MSNSRMFWQRLFINGDIEFAQPPQDNPLADHETRALFARSFETHCRTIAGQLDFCEEIAASAAQILQSAAWYLVSNAGTADEMKQALNFAEKSRSPAEHLSADLTLQYLPCIYQRANALFPADKLPSLLAKVLRSWPLSGVISDVPDAPLGDLEFGGHRGLLLLYAERLAENFKPAWIPRGIGAAYTEFIWNELGKDPAMLRQTAPPGDDS